MRAKSVRRLAWLGLLGLALELGARAYLAFSPGVPYLHPGRALEAYYPELARLRAEPTGADAFDVLLLGGSVLDAKWSTIAERLETLLALQARREVRVHNLAVEAHTTRDSLLKYRRLADSHFDLVVVYHGINEVRANNVPPELFRNDYSHYSWYRYVNATADDPLLPWIAVSLATRRALLKLEQRFGDVAIVPAFEPPGDWARYGADVKTERPFRENLTAILDLAQARGEPVLLMTFAIHVAADYTEADFLAHRLDYGAHTIPILKWGTPEHVARGVEVHNRVVRELAAERETWFVDQAELLPRGRAWFDDICHLTVAGDGRFAQLVVDAVAGLLRHDP